MGGLTNDEVVARLLVLQRQAYDLIHSVNILIRDLLDTDEDDGVG